MKNTKPYQTVNDPNQPYVQNTPKPPKNLNSTQAVTNPNIYPNNKKPQNH